MNLIRDIRRKLGYTQAEMAQSLGITRNYVALLETGRRRITEDIADGVNKLEADVNSDVNRRVAPPASYTAADDLPGQLAEVREELAEMRGEMAEMRSEMRTQMETLLGLLGEPLRAAYQRHQEDRGRAG